MTHRIDLRQLQPLDLRAQGRGLLQQRLARLLLDAHQARFEDLHLGGEGTREPMFF